MPRIRRRYSEDDIRPIYIERRPARRGRSVSPPRRRGVRIGFNLGDLFRPRPRPPTRLVAVTEETPVRSRRPYNVHYEVRRPRDASPSPPPRRQYSPIRRTRETMPPPPFVPLPSPIRSENNSDNERVRLSPKKNKEKKKRRKAYVHHPHSFRRRSPERVHIPRVTQRDIVEDALRDEHLHRAERSAAYSHQTAENLAQRLAEIVVSESRARTEAQRQAEAAEHRAAALEREVCLQEQERRITERERDVAEAEAQQVRPRLRPVSVREPYIVEPRDPALDAIRRAQDDLRRGTPRARRRGNQNIRYDDGSSMGRYP